MSCAYTDTYCTSLYSTGKVDMVVGGAGTGGTIAGIGRKIKEVLPNCKVHTYVCEDDFILKRSSSL